MGMITEIDDYFAKGCGRCTRFDTPDCSTALWSNGLLQLRAICLDVGLAETVKWGHPCYLHAGRNIAIIGAFRGTFRLTFFNASLMTDPDGVLEKQCPNTQAAGVMRFDAENKVATQARTIRSYLQEAMGYADAGLAAPKVVREVAIPEELTDALDADPQLAEAFYALTPGRQKSYAFNLNTAKQSATRIARIAKFRDKIIAGKGALER